MPSFFEVHFVREEFYSCLSLYCFLRSEKIVHINKLFSSDLLNRLFLKLASFLATTLHVISSCAALYCTVLLLKSKGEIIGAVFLFERSKYTYY